MARIVYHGTWDNEFDPKNLNPEESLHVGTEKSARDRLQNLANEFGIKGSATIHQFDMVQRPSPMVYADPSLPSEESETRLAEGKPRWWQAVESVRDTDAGIPRPIRYINEYEDPGSMSYVVMPNHLKHLSTQFVDFGDEG